MQRFPGHATILRQLGRGSFMFSHEGEPMDFHYEYNYSREHLLVALCNAGRNVTNCSGGSRFCQKFYENTDGDEVK